MIYAPPVSTSPRSQRWFRGRGWFQHLAIEVPGEGGRNEWCEPVDDEAYKVATSGNLKYTI